MPCPRCQSDAVTKDGTTPQGGQRFRCGNCRRRFTRRSVSAFSGRLFYRASDGRGQVVDAYVSPRRDLAAARAFVEVAIASSGTTPRRVITDTAGAYPPALATAVPGVRQRTGRYRATGIERDHGCPKDRLRPMRGLESVVSATTFTRGHALARTIRRGFYRVVQAAPRPLVLAWTWDRLSEAV